MIAEKAKPQTLSGPVLRRPQPPFDADPFKGFATNPEWSAAPYRQEIPSSIEFHCKHADAHPLSYASRQNDLTVRTASWIMT